MFSCASSQGRVETVARARHRRPRSRVSDVFVQRAIREYNEEAREEYILKSVRIDGSTPLTTRFDHIRVRSNLQEFAVIAVCAVTRVHRSGAGDRRTLGAKWVGGITGQHVTMPQVYEHGHVILLFFSVWVCGFCVDSASTTPPLVSTWCWCPRERAVRA